MNGLIDLLEEHCKERFYKKNTEYITKRMLKVNVETP